MTREEAIKFLKGYLDEEVYTEKCRNAHEMAIKALEQESCEDAVSREAVKKALRNRIGESISDCIDALPSVKPVACIATVKFSKEDMQELVNEKIKEIVVELKKGDK